MDFFYSTGFSCIIGHMEKDKKTASQPLAVEAKERNKSNKGKVYMVISAVLAVGVFLQAFTLFPLCGSLKNMPILK